MLKGLGSLGDMGKMMKAAQEMQGKMAQMQEDMNPFMSLENQALVSSRQQLQLRVN